MSANRKSSLRRTAATALAAVLLGSCGGGGGGGSSGPSLGGVAATGAPMGAAEITVTCASGAPISTTTSATGAWSVNLAPDNVVPCMVKASGGTPPVTLYSLAAATGNVNVTPLTNLVVAAAAGADPEAWIATNASSLSSKLVELSVALPAAKAAVVQGLTDAGYSLPESDFMTATFTPAVGDPLDDLLEAVAKGTQESGITYGQLVAQVASAGNTPVQIPKGDDLTPTEVASQPQLNSATVVVSNNSAILRIVPNTGHQIGAFFGPGTGNKAILQIPGLAGMKVKDLEKIELDIKPNTPVGSGYWFLYVNILIDLDCNAPALPANATAGQMRERRRLLIFAPYYKFIQEQPGFFTQGSFSKLTIRPDTGGWRITPGAVRNATGQGETGVEEFSHGGQFNLTGFKHDVYPNDCIIDGISADNGMYRETSSACNPTPRRGLTDTDPASCGKPHAGLTLLLGDSVDNNDTAEWEVRKVKVNNRTFNFD